MLVCGVTFTTSTLRAVVSLAYLVFVEVGYFQILVNIITVCNPFVSAVPNINLTDLKGGTHCIWPLLICQKEITVTDTNSYCTDTKIKQ